MKPTAPSAASIAIGAKVAALPDWRGAMFTKVRKTILSVDPAIVEEIKWMGTPVWSRDGIVCTGEVYKDVVKMTFAKGASLPDPSGLFNSSLDGNVRRAIDVHEGDALDVTALKALVRAAIAQNQSKKPATKAKAAPKTKKPAPKAPSTTKKPAPKAGSKAPSEAKEPTPKAKAAPKKTEPKR